MKVASLFGTSAIYTVCQLKYSIDKLHFQSTEAIPGWDARNYGSAKDFPISDKLKEVISSIINHCYTTKSLAGGGAMYIMASVCFEDDDAYQFQILAPGWSDGVQTDFYYFEVAK